MSNAEITAEHEVGGIAGINQKFDNTSTITDCYSLGTVNSTGEIENDPKISATGGIVGYNYENATITRSINEAVITATKDVAGGIAGRNLRNYNLLL